MTVFVYGLVAGIVKLDDLGLYLSRRGGAVARAIGGVLLAAAPKLMKALAVLGTLAMFMVGGSILAHGVPALHHFVEGVAQSVATVPAVGGILKAIAPSLVDAVIGVIAGAVALVVFTGASKLFKRKAH
jgi:predicted DNA repair protein MutK